MSKIPPRKVLKGNIRDLPAEPSRSSSSQPITGRQTKNSIRASKETASTSNNNRLRAQEPIIQRVEQRVLASQTRLVEQSSRNQNNEIPIDSGSPLSDTPEPEMCPPESNPIASTSVRSGPSVQENTRERNIPMPTRKMPKPGEKNAPTFDVEKPEELGRFFERMDDWFADEGINDDRDKKRRIVRYLDPDSELQWKALSKFIEGTFEEFRCQVMESYPQAEEVMKGSVAALKRKIARIGPVAADDRDELLRIIRIMTAEVLKLKKIQPPIHTNRELVELFLSRLDGDFAARVANKLSVHRLLSEHNPGNNLGVRNTEDMYDIDEVMNMAKHTSLEHANPFGKYLGIATGGSLDASTKLEEAVAKLTDTITSQVQHSKQIDQRLANLQSYINQPRSIPPAASSQPQNNKGNAPPQNHINSTYNMACFYCGGPHRIADCESARTHLDMKWVKQFDRYLRLPDGTQIPRIQNKSMKEVVEEMNKTPGIIPMTKIQDKSALYQETSPVTTYIQTQGPETDDLRALTELIQRVGIEQLQQLITTNSNSSMEDIEAEEESFTQNFN